MSATGDSHYDLPTSHSSVLPVQLVLALRIHVDLRDVAARPFEQLGIHDLEPQRRNGSKPKTPSVTARQAWQILKIAQCLIRATCIRVMIGVSLQVKRDQVRVDRKSTRLN